MSSELAVDVRGLSKRYKIRHNVTRPTNFVEALAGGWHRLRRSTVETFWALQDVSFEVKQGDVVGIIGNNGAGKSTMLKILSRIVEPTSGEAFMRGRLGSLLEVGTGFHPDLTGRENIFLNGSMLGMSRAVVQQQFDRIVDFSGVEKFLDTPVKRYSSGMYVRLAFSVAAHLDCDVLIVDEVLAVGDDSFQKKCLGKMSEVVGQGRTVMFVSHNMAAVSALTNRTLLFEHGRLVFDGATATAVERYLEQGDHGRGTYVAEARPGEPTVTRVDIRTSQGGRVQEHGAPFEVQVDVATPSPVAALRVGVTLINRLGRACAYAWLREADVPSVSTPGRYRYTCELPHLRLAPGQYSVRVFIADRHSHKRELVERLCPFEVVMPGLLSEGWNANEVAYFEDAQWTSAPVAQAGSGVLVG